LTIYLIASPYRGFDPFIS
jgi:hypothetical protein